MNRADRAQGEKIMAFAAKPNTGGLFENTKNDRSDLSGQIEIECPRCHQKTSWWMNGWRKVSQSGLSYINVVLKPKLENPAAKQEEPRQPH